MFCFFRNLFIIGLACVLIGGLFLRDFKPGNQSHRSTQAVYSVSSQDNLSLDLFFNAVNTNQTTNESFLLTAVEQSILGSKESIEIFMYSIDSMYLVDLLNEATERGVKVDVYTDWKKRKYTNLHFPKSRSKVKLHYLNKDAPELENRSFYMHHKAVIIDNKELYWGSNNLTWFQDEFDPGFMIRTQDKDFLAAINLELDNIRKGVSTIDKLSLSKYNPYLAEIEYADSKIEFWRSPGYKSYSVRNKIIEIINESKEDLKLMMWYLTDYKVFTALMSKVKQGLNVTILIDNFTVENENSVFYKNLSFLSQFPNVQILQDSVNQNLIDFSRVPADFNSFFHFHTLISDNSVIVTGSNNWSYGGFFTNDELTLITDNKLIISEFINVFEYFKDLFS